MGFIQQSPPVYENIQLSMVTKLKKQEQQFLAISKLLELKREKNQNLEIS